VKNTIGINISHDPAVVLISASGIVGAVEEEKLRQIKSYRGFPFESCRYIASLLPKNEHDRVDITIGCERLREFCVSRHHIKKYFGYNNSRFNQLFDFIYFHFLKEDKKESLLRLQFEILLRDFFKVILPGINIENVIYVNHHLAHAYSAAIIQLDNLYIFTSDGRGDGESAAIYKSDKSKIHQIASFDIFASLGQIYSSATGAIGFIPNRHEGKLTGLSATGNPEVFYNFLSELCGSPTNFYSQGSRIYKKMNFGSFIAYISTKGFTSLFNDFWWLLKISELNANSRKFQIGSRIYSTKMREFISKNNTSNADVASGVQKYCEEATIHLIREYTANESCNVALAGGLFANVKINQKIFDLANVKDVFVQPAMHDAGTALGSALLHSSFKSPLNADLDEMVHLGPEYSLDNLGHERDLSLLVKSNFSIEEVARLIESDNIIGVFNGRLEFGPRALGNRSILATAKNKNITGLLNGRLNRNDFMPFAPLIIEDDAEEILIDYSLSNVAANFMTCTFQVKAKYQKQLEAIVHIDGSVRPQVVRKNEQPMIYDLLQEIKLITGLGVCINTSFNLHEYPIASSPADALKILKAGGIDYLILGNLLLSHNN
jgi:carbamoyltransferase